MKDPRRPSVDNAAYRKAVEQIVRRIQTKHGLSDSQLADRLCCSAGTIKNARHRATNLDAVTLANIESVFGPGAIDPYLAMVGARVLPLSTRREEFHPTLPIAEALHRIIEAQTPASEGGTRITSRELLAILDELRDARNTFDALIMIADPAKGSSEASFWEKGPKRIAVVHTEGKTIARATIIQDGASA